MKNISRLLAAVAASALAACSTTPPENPDVTAARAAVDQARLNPYVARSAAIEVERAQQALRRAETAWADERDREQTRHLAYLATQRAAIAQEVGAQAQGDERLQQAGGERERARLEARTREADARGREAEAATRQARAAQASASSAQSQAEAAQRQADAARQQAAQQAQRAASLERDLQSLQARSTERGMVVTLGDVLFDTGRAVLKPGAQRNVDQLVSVLGQYPERRVMIEGFTDNVGGDDSNLALSRRRAEAFQQALINGGVPAERIEVRAYGEAYPVADNASAAGRQQNRRVEVLFSDAQGRFAAR